MLGLNENSACIFHIRCNELVTFRGQLSKDRLKRYISPFLEVGFEKFFDNHLQNYIGKVHSLSSGKSCRDPHLKIRPITIFAFYSLNYSLAARLQDNSRPESPTKVETKTKL